MRKRVQTNAYHYYHHHLRHNMTGRQETAADVNTLPGGYDAACVGRWIRERPDNDAHCSASFKTPVSVVSLLISALAWKERETEDIGQYLL